MNQFGGTKVADDYDFFAPSRSAATGAVNGAPTGAHFGGAPTPGAGHAAPRAPRGPRSPATVALLVGLVVAGIAGAAWYGWGAYQRSQPLTMPPIVAGQTPAEAPRLDRLGSELAAELAADNQGVQTAIETYGSPKRFTVVAALRGSVDLDAEFAAAGPGAVVTDIGDTRCAIAADASVMACERTSPTLTVAVVRNQGTPAEAAAVVDEVWELQ